MDRTLRIDRPLVVDLDGTLVRCDLLHDALASLAARAPFRLARLAWQHRRSLAGFKTAVAALVPVEAALLPYRTEVVDRLQEATRNGRAVVLATASARRWADSVAHHLGCFRVVLATDGQTNLRGEQKLRGVRAAIGQEEFDYLGDGQADLPVMRAAHTRIVVGKGGRLGAALHKLGLPFEQVDQPGTGQVARAFLRLCRPHHWAKNLIVFLPVLTSAGSYDPGRWHNSVLAFLALCCVASGIYIGNDAADIREDRAHPEKRFRPLAAGLIAVPLALAGAAVLVLGGLFIGALLGTAPLALLAAYWLCNVAYTMWIKAVPLADVVVLTAFYLLRLVLGTVVLGVSATPWFLAFLGCLFTELALWKRYVEILRSPASAARRGYRAPDAPVLLVFGVGFSFCATFILALYLQSGAVSPLYKSPGWLLLLAPVLLGHNLGMWLDGSRGFTSGDPVLRVLRSRKSWVAAAASALLILAARGFTR